MLKPSVRASLAVLSALSIIISIQATAIGQSVKERVRPGDIVRDFGVGVTVPPPGKGVWAIGLKVDGGEQVLGARTAKDGSVTLLSVGEELQASSSEATISAIDECSDSAYVLHEWSWGLNRYDWFYNTASKPSNLTVADVVAELKAGITNITNANNNCGRGDNVSATHAYQGTTTTDVSISFDGTCGPEGTLRDGVLGWGLLDPQWVAYACVWYLYSPDGPPWTAYRSDVKFNSDPDAVPWYINGKMSCNNRYDVRNATSHEIGHTFGIAHVTGDSHANLTMYNVLYWCETRKRTLGLGDMLGLEQLY